MAEMFKMFGKMFRGDAEKMGIYVRFGDPVIGKYYRPTPKTSQPSL